MLNFQDTHFVLTMSVMALAYIVSIYLLGIAQIQLVALMGDKSVLRRFAPSTFYPLEHFDVFGFIFFLTSGFGWSKTLTIRQHAIRGRFRRLRLFIARNAQIITCLTFAIIALFISYVGFGEDMYSFFLRASHPQFAASGSLVALAIDYFPKLSSWSTVVSVLLSSVATFFAANATIHLFLNIMNWIYGRVGMQYYLAEDDYATETLMALIIFRFFGWNLFENIIDLVIMSTHILASLLRI